MRSAETELQNTLELPATVSEIAAPKPDVDAKAEKDDFEALFKRNFKRKITSVKIVKIYSQITIAAWMQPLQYDLRCSAGGRGGKTIVLRMQPRHRATLTQPLQCDLQRLGVAKHTRTTRNGVGNCSSKTGCRRQSRKKTILKHFLKGILKGKLLAWKL